MLSSKEMKLEPRKMNLIMLIICGSTSVDEMRAFFLNESYNGHQQSARYKLYWYKESFLGNGGIK